MELSVDEAEDDDEEEEEEETDDKEDGVNNGSTVVFTDDEEDALDDEEEDEDDDDVRCGRTGVSLFVEESRFSCARFKRFLRSSRRASIPLPLLRLLTLVAFSNMTGS